jgi:CubicO group peptidase (beta-lactamase class C family)
MRPHRPLVVARAALAAAALLPARLAAQHPQAPERLAAQVDSVFAAYRVPGSPGCAVAVSERGATTLARGYGAASLEHDVPITPRTAFYAASVSKQFTAYAVALLAREGRLSLDDDVRKWIPEVPDFGKRITVRHLVHHTSGLRDYFGLLGMTGWPSDGPLTVAQFLDLVGRQRSLNFDPGARHLYSNTGYVLLAVLVERVTGQPLRQYADSAIFRPLGMRDTRFRDDHAAIVPNRALAYQSRRGGGWQLGVPGFDVVGDGGLYTTAEDLARWARSLAHEPTVGGRDLVALTRTRGRLAGGDSIPYAFGVSHDAYRGRAVVQHGGAYGGYRSYLLLFPDDDVAVATLCNAATANPVALSQRVADVFLGDRLAAAPARAIPAANVAPASAPAVTVPAERLAAYAGAYWDARTESLRRFAVRDGALAGSAGGAWVPLVPAAVDEFRLGGGPTVLRFVAAPGGGWQVEEVAPTGERVAYRRMPEPRTAPGDLAGYAGTYRSEELDARWRVEVAEGRLVVRRRALPDQALEPVFADAFAHPVGVVRFTRDAAGRVTGFVVGAGRVTGFQFAREGTPGQ